MTRKDYVSIAAALARVYALATMDHPDQDLTGADCAALAARQIADVMACDNPRFDRARFLKACGVQS